MKVYIIHSPRFQKNYIERILNKESEFIKAGNQVLNPLPDKTKELREPELHKMYESELKNADAVFAMDGWDKTDIGNAEMSAAMILRKTIIFEQKV